MVEECKALKIDSGEVCYSLAQAVIFPENIYIKEITSMYKEGVERMNKRKGR